MYRKNLQHGWQHFHSSSLRPWDWSQWNESWMTEYQSEKKLRSFFHLQTRIFCWEDCGAVVTRDLETSYGFHKSLTQWFSTFFVKLDGPLITASKTIENSSAFSVLLLWFSHRLVSWLWWPPGLFVGHVKQTSIVCLSVLARNAATCIFLVLSAWLENTTSNLKLKTFIFPMHKNLHRKNLQTKVHLIQSNFPAINELPATAIHK